MRRVKHSNPILNKILVIIGAAIFAAAIVTYAVYTYSINNDFIYDLGEKTEIKDTFLTSYEEYTSFINENGFASDLNENDFKNNYYLASIQEYDKCSEKKYKTVSNVRVEDERLKITLNVHNKCGFCKKKYVLYLVKLDKISLPINVQYEYLFENDLICGSI